MYDIHNEETRSSIYSRIIDICVMGVGGILSTDVSTRYMFELANLDKMTSKESYKIYIVPRLGCKEILLKNLQCFGRTPP